MIRLEPHNAQLLLQIYELRREEKLRRAREWFLKSFVADTSAEFAALCPVGSENNAFFRMVATYWDMVASIVNRGMLDEDFYFENTTESLLVWLRMRNVVQEMRVTRKNPLYLRNIAREGMDGPHFLVLSYLRICSNLAIAKTTEGGSI